ncbi:spermidine synthase [Escherichia coli]|uniref:Spermidine synthase n=1 Tax=Escherichia coli TaxID=562 RepID=A0A484YLP3_ECOLX|nr:spermidine synthase [Escherichia coli]
MAEKKQWHETLHDQFGQYFAVDNVLYHEKTDHQDLIIFGERRIWSRNGAGWCSTNHRA